MSGGDLAVSLIAGLAALFLAFRGLRGSALSGRSRMIAVGVWVVLIVGLAAILS